MFFIILQARRMKHVQLNKCAWNNRITKGVGNPSMIQNQYITEKKPHTLVFDCNNYICLKWCRSLEFYYICLEVALDFHKHVKHS